MLPNGPAFVTAFLAITGLGAIVVPLNRQFKVDELAFCLKACGAREAIADEEEIERLIEGHPRKPIDPRLPEETLVYQFSSGSTGRPKRLARTHGQLWAEAESYTWITSEDRLFCAIPLFHTYGMGCCLVAAPRNGAALVFLDEHHPFQLSRGRALDLLERERVTVFPGVPFQFRLLADAPGDADLSSLRLCFSAGTALPRAAFDAFAAASASTCGSCTAAPRRARWRSTSIPTRSRRSSPSGSRTGRCAYGSTTARSWSRARR